MSVNWILARVWVNTTGITPRWLDAAIGLVMPLPLALRRRAPLTSSVLIAVGCALALLVGTGPSPAVLAVPLTVFSTAKWGGRADSRIVLVMGPVGALALGVWAYMLALQNSMGPGGRPVDRSELIARAPLRLVCSQFRRRAVLRHRGRGERDGELHGLDVIAAGERLEDPALGGEGINQHLLEIVDRRPGHPGLLERRVELGAGESPRSPR